MFFTLKPRTCNLFFNHKIHRTESIYYITYQVQVQGKCCIKFSYYNIITYQLATRSGKETRRNAWRNRPENKARNKRKAWTIRILHILIHWVFRNYLMQTFWTFWCSSKEEGLWFGKWFIVFKWDLVLYNNPKTLFLTTWNKISLNTSSGTLQYK